MQRKPNIIQCFVDWYDRYVEQPARAEAQAKATAAKLPKVRTPATDRDRLAIAALAGVCFGVGTPAKRFARQIQGATELTAAQRAYLWACVYRYRRQIADAGLVEEAKRRQAPESCLTCSERCSRGQDRIENEGAKGE